MADNACRLKVHVGYERTDAYYSAFTIVLVALCGATGILFEHLDDIISFI